MSSLIRWNPLRDMVAMQRTMDRMMDRFAEEPWTGFGDSEPMLKSLSLDIHEDDKAYTVVTELPGVPADQIQISIDGDHLVIEGEVKQENEQQDEQKRTLLKERRYGKYTRRIRLPQAVEIDKVEAVSENGILTLTLPKSEETRPKLIPVKVGKS